MKDKSEIKNKHLIKEFNYVNKLNLSKCNIPITDLIDSMVCVCITEKKIIRTCIGYNLIIKGHLQLKIRYLSNDCEGKMFLKKFCIPIFEVIPLRNCLKILNIKPELAFCDIDILDCNTICLYSIVSIIISFCPDDCKPIICQSSDSDCNSEKKWNFKNDCYPNTGMVINSKAIYPPSNENCKNSNENTDFDNKYTCFNEYKYNNCLNNAIISQNNTYIE